jgi:hypothetical protein
MDARILAAIFLSFVGSCGGLGAESAHRVTTKNFVIHAPDERLARMAAEQAEKYRKDLSLDWLGYEIRPWRERCPVHITVSPHAGGETSFAFVDGPGAGEPIGWQMKIFGPPNRLLDSVLPHEITHTIFATHFGRPLPRWADEGACTSVEHQAERAKNHQMLMDFLTAKPSRGIPFNRMFTMKQYPHDILPLYAQGYSVARFLIELKGRKHFIKFVEDGLRNEVHGHDPRSWDRATEQYYGFKDLSELQVTWLGWVRHGCPDPKLPSPREAIAASQSTRDESDLDEGNPVDGLVLAPHQMGLADTYNPAADQITKSDMNSAQTLDHSGSWYLQRSRTTQSEAVRSAEVHVSDSKTANNSASDSTEFLPGSTGRHRSDIHRWPISKARPGQQTIWR